VCAPHNNKQLTTTPKYTGLGGHLLDIAAEESEAKGYGGYMYGFASNKKLLEHYCSKELGGMHFPQFHPYQVIWDENAAHSILERYNYERH
jgi:hypothetical protein